MVYSYMTDIGRVRNSNQDYLFASAQPVGPLGNLFLIADGMGGHKAGEYASSHTVAAVLGDIRESTLHEPIAVLEHAIDDANRIIYTEASSDPDKRGMGTTLVAATISGQHLYVANVGDSRLYLSDPTGICQITRDHSLVEEMLRSGGLTPEMAENNPNKNIITRAVGADETVKADFFDLFLQPDEEILMCTDGLTNMLSDEEIHGILISDLSVEDRATRLIEKANENGGRDNVSAIIVDPFADEEKA